MAWIALTVLAVYSHSIAFSFLDLDDRVNVADNVRFKPPTASSLAQFWREPFLSLYVPVTYTWFGFEAALAQRTPSPELPERIDPRVFHAGNVLLHLIGSWLVYALFMRLLAHRGAACVGALFYAVHPLHVESVAWITETKGLLAAVFSLLALLALLRLAARERFSWVTALCASGAFALALLSKPSAVTVPLIGLALVGLQGTPRKPRVVGVVVLWLIAAAALTVFTKGEQPDSLIEEVPGVIERIGVALDTTTFYLGKLLVPVGLCPDYGRTPQVALASAVRPAMWLVPLAVTAVVAYVPQRRWTLSAWAIFLLAIAPVSGLVPFGFQNYSTVADRYTCFALLGPAMLVAVVCCAWWSRSAMIGGALICGALAAVSLAQIGHWRDTQSLFMHTLTVNPRSYLAHEKLAAVARRRGDLATAIEHLEASVAIKATAEHHNKLGDALFRAGRTAEAEREFAQAVALNPRLKEPHCNLGIALAQRGAWAAAIEAFRRALAIDPHYAFAQRNLEIATAKLNTSATP